MNFTPESGYDVLLRILLDFGMPVREKLGQQGQVLSTQESSISNDVSRSTSENYSRFIAKEIVPFQSNLTPISLPVQPNVKDQYESRHNTHHTTA